MISLGMINPKDEPIGRTFDSKTVDMLFTIIICYNIEIKGYLEGWFRVL